MKFKDIMPVKGFNTSFSEQAFQPLWFDIIGVALTAAGILLFINSIKKDTPR
jgi:hypothetical protein